MLVIFAKQLCKDTPVASSIMALNDLRNAFKLFHRLHDSAWLYPNKFPIKATVLKPSIFGLTIIWEPKITLFFSNFFNL